MKWVLKCETPVHVGTGRSLEPYEYLVRGGRYIVFNLNAALRRLEEERPNAAADYAEYVAKILVSSSQQDEPWGRQRKRVFPSDANIVTYCERVLRDRELADRLLSDAAVSLSRAEGVDWQPHGKHRKVREIIKANGRPYLPGTSVKGALRTALAYAVLTGPAAPRLKELLLDGDRPTGLRGIRTALKELKAKYGQLAEVASKRPGELSQAARRLKNERRRVERFIGDTVEKVLYRWGEWDQRRNRISFDNPQQDLWRFVHVSDTQRAQSWLTVSEIRALARRQSDRSSEIPIPAELLDEGSAFEVDIAVNVPALRAAAVSASREESKQNPKRWVMFAEKFEWLFGQPIQTLLQLQPGQYTLWGENAVQKILDRANVHALSVLERDTRWLTGFSPAEVRSLKEQVRSMREEAASKPLLRLGFSSGWHATTVALALEAWGESELLATLLYDFLMDLPQRAAQIVEQGRNPEMLLGLLARSPNASTFPTSRRVIYVGGRPKSFVGWVSLKPGLVKSGKPSRENEQQASTTGSVQTAGRGKEVTADMLKALSDHFRGG